MYLIIYLDGQNADHLAWGHNERVRKAIDDYLRLERAQEEELILLAEIRSMLGVSGDPAKM